MPIIQPPQGPRQIGLPGPEVIDPGNRQFALSGLNYPMGVKQKRDPVLPGRCQDITLQPIPALMIAHDGEGAVPGADPGHLLHAPGKKCHRVRDVIPGEDKQIGVKGCNLIGIAPHFRPGPVNCPAWMSVSWTTRKPQPKGKVSSRTS